MKHLPLFPHKITRKAFHEEAPKLTPLYKLKQTNGRSVSFIDSALPQLSSPVCYADLKSFREGF